MLQQTSTFPRDLDRLIRGAIELARKAGKPDVLARLEAALGATDSSGPAEFQLDILASEVRVFGNTVALSRGERMLMISLALFRKAATRAELMERLYPHLDEITAATQLKVYVHRVRRRVGNPEIVISQSGTYRLGSCVHVDLWEAEALVSKALAIKGVLPADVGARLAEYRSRLLRRDVSWTADQEWCDALERRLENLLADATVRLGESALANNDVATALGLAVEISEVDPSDERAAELAIRAHLSNGDRESAARVLRRYERILREEYSAKPSPHLAALL